jgi:hypothetical protein
MHGTWLFSFEDLQFHDLLQEVLNVHTGANSGDNLEWSGHVVHAAVVLESRRKDAKDPFTGDGPLFGVL